MLLESGYHMARWGPGLIEKYKKRDGMRIAKARPRPVLSTPPKRPTRTNSMLRPPPAARPSSRKPRSNSSRADPSQPPPPACALPR